MSKTPRHYVLGEMERSPSATNTHAHEQSLHTHTLLRRASKADSLPRHLGMKNGALSYRKNSPTTKGYLNAGTGRYALLLERGRCRAI